MQWQTIPEKLFDGHSPVLMARSPILMMLELSDVSCNSRLSTCCSLPQITSSRSLTSSNDESRTLIWLLLYPLGEAEILGELGLCTAPPAGDIIRGQHQR